jgi:hypothetical protein
MKRKRPERSEPEPIDLDQLVCPAELLPDRRLPVEERRARSHAREAWYQAHGLGKRPGDFVRRSNAEIRGWEASGLREPPMTPDPREFFCHLGAHG